MSQAGNILPVVELPAILEQRRQFGRRYLEFLRVSALSAGVYVLPTDGIDPQQPHREDEIYYVLNGRGMIQIEGRDYAVQAGSMVFVPALAVHRFHTITEELSLLVVFGPAESGSA